MAMADEDVQGGTGGAEGLTGDAATDASHAGSAAGGDVAEADDEDAPDGDGAELSDEPPVDPDADEEEEPASSAD